MSARLALVGVAAGALSGLLGIGGGIVIVPGLIWAAGLDRHTASGTSLLAILPIAGLDRHTASGTSLLAILPIAVVAAVTYAVVPGGAFDAEASAIFVGGSLAGAVVGARVNARTSERALRLTMAILALLFGLRLVIPLGFGAGKEELPLDLLHVLLLVYLGFQGGFMSGLLGVGGGAIAIAVLAAIGTSQVLAQGIAITATIPTVVVGALQHRRQGTLAPREGLVVGFVGMALAIPGALLAFAVPVEVLRTGFGVFLLFGSYRMFSALRRVPAPEPAS